MSAAEQLAGRVQLLEHQIVLKGQLVVAHMDGRGNLFERGVPGAFANAVDRAFHLARPGFERSQTIGDRQAQIIMAMAGENHIFHARHALAQQAKHRRVLLRNGVADGVRKIDDGGSGCNGDADHLAQKIRVGARRVFRRKLHVMDMLAGQTNRRVGLFQRLLAGDLQLVLQMNVGAGKKDVNARTARRFERACGGFDVLLLGARKAGNLRPTHLAGNQLNGCKVALGGNGKASLHHINAQRFQLPGHAQFFRGVHAASRRLLAVAQRRVEKLDAFLTHAMFPVGVSVCIGIRAVSPTAAIKLP